MSSTSGSRSFKQIFQANAERQERIQKRSDILHRASRGALTKDAAEAEALREGCGPLSFSPDRKEYHIDNGEPWTMFMALAWIRWRTSEAVLDFYLPYLRDCRAWHSRLVALRPKILKGAILQTRESECNLSALRTRNCSGQNPGQLGFQQAEEMLWDALRREEIIAIAICKGTDSIVQIQAIEWEYLRLWDSHDPVLVRKTKPSKKAYTDIQIDGRNVMEVWKAASFLDNDQPNSLVKNEEHHDKLEVPIVALTPREKVEVEYAGIMALLKQHVDSGSRISRKGFELEAKEHGFRSTKARDVFKNYRPGDWKSGRRPA